MTFSLTIASWAKTALQLNCLCRKVTIVTNGTNQQRIDMRVATCSEALDYAVLECDPDVHSDHLQVQTFAHDQVSLSTGDMPDIDELVGAPLVVCTFESAVHKDSPGPSQDRDIRLGIMPAYGCKLSATRHHLLYDVRCWCGCSGAALVLYKEKVVGLHARTVTVASSPSQAFVALLCHAFVR